MRISDWSSDVCSSDLQLRFSTRFPDPSPSMKLPPASTSAASMPKKGFVALPGLVGLAPGRGEIWIPPVSVCHHVSTMGSSPLPPVRLYHSPPSGLLASPPSPRRRRPAGPCPHH